MKKKSTSKPKKEKTTSKKSAPKAQVQIVKPIPFPLPPQPKNFKQIEYNNETGKLSLIDYNNEHFECNIMGQRLPTFKPYITGVSGYKERFIKNMIPPLQIKPDKNSYLPTTKFIEGYFPCPNPLSLPFVNECYNPYLFQKEISKENRITYEKNKRVIELKIPSKDMNCMLTYLTTSITSKSDKDTKMYLIKLVDDYIQDLRNKCKFEPQRIEKNSEVKALRKFKKLLLINMDDTVIASGKKLNTPNGELIPKFNMIKKLIAKGPKVRSESHNEKIYKEMYKIRGIKSILSKEESNRVHKRNKYFSPKVENPDNSGLSGNNMMTTYSNMNTLYNNKTVSTGFNITHHTQQNFFSERRKAKVFDDIRHSENLSFLLEEEKKDFQEEENPKMLKTFTCLKKNCETEEKLLMGFEPEKKKDRGIILKFKKKIKTPGDAFKNDIELMKKVNPIAFKKEEERETLERQMMDKKRRNRMIYEKIKIK